MNSKVTTDLSFGRDNEIRVKQRLQALFGPLEETDPMDEFDFKNDNFYIELKTRRVTKNKYHTTMVGENKVLKGLPSLFFSVTRKPPLLYFLFKN